MSKHFALLAVILISVSLSAQRMHRARSDWTPDGYIYLRMALQDRGLTAGEAERAANLFIRTTDEGRSDAKFYSAAPPEFFRQQPALFRTRPLYPYLASRLPLSAPMALKAVSAAAYALVPVVIFFMLMGAGSGWIAAVGAVGIAFLPVVRDPAGLPLTDELALLFWVSTIAVLLAYLRKPSTLSLFALILAIAGLAFTRPAIQLAIAAIVVPLVLARRANMRRRLLVALTATIGVAFTYVLYSAIVHGPGIMEELHWEFAWQRAVGGPFIGDGFSAWWIRSFAATVVSTPGEIFNDLGYFTIILAAAGLFLHRSSTIAPVAIGATLCAVATILSDPFPFSLARTIVLPISPIVVMLATLSLFALDRVVRREFSMRPRIHVEEKVRPQGFPGADRATGRT